MLTIVTLEPLKKREAAKKNTRFLSNQFYKNDEYKQKSVFLVFFLIS